MSPGPPPARLPRPRVGLVSDRHRLCAAAGYPLSAATALLAAQVEAAGACGVEFFQVREPDLGGAALLALTRELLAVSRGRVRVVVNDRADVAALAGADLHLKGGSLPLARIRSWLPPHTWVSRAVHDPAELPGAAGADALIAGTVRRTVSKPGATRWLGVDGLARLARATAQPVFAIGGVTAADWPALAGAGAAGLAAIGWMLPRPGEDAGTAVARAMSDIEAVMAASGPPHGLTS